MTSRRILYPVTAILILWYFVFFTGPSVHMYFDSDDLYSLYFCWSQSVGQILKQSIYLWTGAFRPLTWLFYRGLLAVVGFDPLPFRIASLAVCVFNLWLCFWFTKVVSGSERTAALATLIFTFQARMIEVWYRTTVIADVMCFTFGYIAACLYIEARQDDRDLGVGRIAAILVLFVCALDSKEFSVALPLFLVVWELLFNLRGFGRFLRSRAAVMIAVMGVLTVVYMVGKLHGAAAMTNNPTYTPQYTFARFSETWGEYLKDIFVLQDRPVPAVAMSILGGMLALAAALRSRVLAFAWVIVVFGLLPVSFSPARGGYEIYFSWMGWVIYAAGLLVCLQDLVTQNAQQYRTALACVVFVLAGWRYGRVNLHALRTEDRIWLYASPAAIREFVTEITAMHPTLPRGARVMFLEDNIGWGEWTPLFIMKVFYNDPTLVLDRLKSKSPDKGPHWEQYSSGERVHYDYVFTYTGGRYVEAPAPLAAAFGLVVSERHQ